MGERIYLESVRISYPHLFTPRAVNPGDEPKFGAAFIVPNDHKAWPEINAAVQKVIAEAFGPQPGVMKDLPLKVGEKYYPGDPNYAGCTVLNTSAKTKPHVVDQNVKPVMDAGMIYAGCFVNASISIYTYKRPTGKGVAFGLDGVQFLRDGDRLDGRPAAENLFERVQGSPAPVAPVPGMPGGFGQGSPFN